MVFADFDRREISNQAAGDDWETEVQCEFVRPVDVHGKRGDPRFRTNFLKLIRKEKHRTAEVVSGVIVKCRIDFESVGCGLWSKSIGVWVRLCERRGEADTHNCAEVDT